MLTLDAPITTTPVNPARYTSDVAEMHRAAERPTARARTREQAERLYADHFDLIVRLVARCARRYRLDREETADFAGEVHVWLLQRDLIVLRQYCGDEGALPAYLTIVIRRCLLDMRNRNWGRFRPSAAATKLGPVASSLERLIVRDGHTLDEACEILRAMSGSVIPKEELEALGAQLPQRPRPVRVNEAEAGAVPCSRSTVDRLLLDVGRPALHAHTRRALSAAWREMSGDDRRLLVLKHVRNLTVSQIARELAVEQRPLYTRLQQLYHQFQHALEVQGIGRAEVAWLLE
jgi:RNA polymerase sigma factor for flagellar operon FliA